MNWTSPCYKHNDTIPTNLIVKELVFTYLGSLEVDSFLTTSIIESANAAIEKVNAAIERIENTDVSQLQITLQAQSLDTGITVTSKYGGAERSQATVNAETISVDSFKLDTDVDDTQSFLKACALGMHVKATAKKYKIVGEIPLASGTTLEFTNNPDIEIDCSGDFGRGFYFGEGVHDAKIIGTANITAYATTLTTLEGDGSRQGVFTWASDYYAPHDRQRTHNCDVLGNFIVTVTGTVNIKIAQAFGYIEDCDASGIRASGKSNFAFVCHWVGNGTETTIPTKTWHPHNITFNKLIADNGDGSGDLLRAITFSACGRIVLKDCQSINAKTLGLNLFVGDYGFLYAQNITQEQAFDIIEHNTQVFTQGNAVALSIDGVSSGKNGAPVWAGCDNNASVTLNGFKNIRGSTSSGITAGISGIKNLTGSINIIDKNINNKDAVAYITSIDNVDMKGSIKANGSIRYRDCNIVKSNIEFTPLQELLDVTSYQLLFNANSYVVTTIGEVVLGASNITISSITGVAGRGGYIVYNDGTKTHEIELLSTAYVGGQQTLKIKPSPVTIPSNSTVTVISVPCKRGVIEGSLGGVRTPIRFDNSGSHVNARARNVTVNAAFNRSGLYDIDAIAIDGLKVTVNSDYCGITTTTVNSASVKLGDNAINWNVNGSKFGKGTNVRYIVWATNSSFNGLADNNIFESLNVNATSPACIFNSGAINVKIGTLQVNNTGKPLTYP